MGPSGLWKKGKQKTKLANWNQTPRNPFPVKLLGQMEAAHQVSITPDKNVET